MSKKVLVISSSPRRGGNSDRLSDELVKGALEAGNNVEKVFLKDKKINYCTGCGVCNNNDGAGCVQQDDMNSILKQMIEADAIVMATPVYLYTMCGQMKTFIDRCCAMYTKITNKEFYFIMTAADTREAALMRTLEEFRGFLACLENSVEKDTLFGVGVWQSGEVEKTRYLKVAFDMGKNI